MKKFLGAMLVLLMAGCIFGGDDETDVIDDNGLLPDKEESARNTASADSLISVMIQGGEDMDLAGAMSAMEDIAELCNGSLPRMRFLYKIVKYSYPRRFRTFVPVSQDKLSQWSSHRTYIDYLKEFEEKEIVTRGKAYSDGSQNRAFSKNLKLNWEYRKSTNAILYEGRSLDYFDDTVKLIYKPFDK